MVLGEIIGWDLVIVLGIIALLFGGAKLPKLARSLGSAKGEFEKGLREGDSKTDKTDKADKAEKTDKAEASEKSDTAEKSDT
jgi:sec-independent protein translocase protein TatA